MTRPVVEELAELRDRMTTLWSTPCVDCACAYAAHRRPVRWKPNEPNPTRCKLCRCKAWRDPSEILGLA